MGLAKRGISTTYRAARRSACALLSPFERRSLRRAALEHLSPPLFVVGAPRTGTTLFYQLCVQRFRLAYFPNLSNALFEVPVTAARLARRLYRPHRSDFSSRFGKVRGGMAPHEAGNVWNRWFSATADRGHYTAEGVLGVVSRDEIRRTVAALEAAFGAPFLNKNVLNSIRIRALNEIFPEARFIHVHRDPLDAASSILQVRQRLGLNQDRWWSVIPREVEHLRGKPLPEQVAGQIRHVERTIVEDAAAIGAHRLLSIAYEDVCRDPRAELNRLAAFVEAGGAKLAPRGEVPARFERSRSAEGLSNSERDALQAGLRAFDAEEFPVR